MQDDSGVAHKDVNIFCNTKTFPSLTFCGTCTKSHGVRGLSNRYHMQFDPKLVHIICAILRIPFACVECTSMLDKYLVRGFPPQKQPRYQPVPD